MVVRKAVTAPGIVTRTTLLPWQTALVIAGWLCLLAGATTLGLTVGPHIAATMDGGLRYVEQPHSVSTGAGLILVVIFGPPVGFNLVYWGLPARLRPAHLAACFALLVIELGVVALSTIWMIGANQPGDRIFGDSYGSSDGAIGVQIGLVVVAAAPLIMWWLGQQTTYDLASRSGKLARTGKATVDVTPISIRAHVAWVIGLFLAWVVLVLPVIPVATRGTPYADSSGGSHDWPAQISSGSSLDTALSMTGAFYAIPWGVALSMLVSKCLYASVWSERRERSPLWKSGRRRTRILVKFRHWPLTIGAVVLGVAIGSAGTGGLGAALGGGFVALVVFGGVGVLLSSRAWKVRNLKRITFTLQESD